MNPFVLAFDFGGTKAVVLTADSSGQVIHEVTLQTSDVDGAQAVLSQSIALGQSLVERTRVDSDRCLELRAIGISTMGITFPDRVEMAPNVPGWGQLRISEAMTAAFGDVPVRIENDVKAATLAELRQGELRGTQVGLYLNIGTGIALGLTIGDDLIRGRHGAAGEIAYNLLSPNERYGYKSGVAPFEEFAGGGAIGRRATERFGRMLSAKQVFELAATDSDMRAFRDEALAVLAHHVTNAVIQWDPERVVVGGGLAKAEAVILPYLKRHFGEFVPFPPEVRVSAFQSGASIHGAIELALDVI